MTTHPQSQAVSVKKPRFRFTLARGVIAELKKVVWPSRQETLRLTLIVIAVCVVVGIILGLVDFGFTTFFDKLLVSGR